MGYYELQEAPAITSSVQAAGLHLAIAGAPSPPQGLAVGMDAMTGWPVYFDQFEGYAQKRFGSPAVSVIGAVGSGKSSLIKTTFVLRQLLLGRRVVVVDKKTQAVNRPDGSQSRQGEYTTLAGMLNVAPVVFDRNAASPRKINVLDPAITVDTGTEARNAEQVSQGDLLRVIAEEALHRPPSPTEKKALRLAHGAAIRTARQAGTVATIEDVVTALLQPEFIEDGYDMRGVRTTEELREWGLTLGLALEDLVKNDLSGLIDGQTSSDLDLDSPLTVFDISRLPEQGPAIAIVMSLIDTWLQATLARQEVTVPTVFVTEEGWYLVKGSIAGITQRNIKQARGDAYSGVTALQHLADVSHDPLAVSVVREADTVFIYRQGQEADAEECVRLFNLPPAAKRLIMELDQGTCLMLVGSEPPVLLAHVRSPIEEEMANTDDAMTSQGTVVLSDRHRTLMEQVKSEYEQHRGDAA